MWIQSAGNSNHWISARKWLWKDSGCLMFPLRLVYFWVRRKGIPNENRIPAWTTVNTSLLNVLYWIGLSVNLPQPRETMYNDGSRLTVCKYDKRPWLWVQNDLPFIDKLNVSPNRPIANILQLRKGESLKGSDYDQTKLWHLSLYLQDFSGQV